MKGANPQPDILKDVGFRARGVGFPILGSESHAEGAVRTAVELSGYLRSLVT